LLAEAVAIEAERRLVTRIGRTANRINSIASGSTARAVMAEWILPTLLPT
jgi:hypothetical protein